MAGYAGFDSSGYPGDATLDWLKQHTNFAWCGFYLAPTPSHPGASWMPKRARLVAAGWGIAPIYVGQQTVGPGSHQVNAHQGYVDGDETAALMKAAGFPAGSCVYLDLENGLPFPPAQQAYVRAWADQVEHHGLQAGMYCSYTFAAQLHQVVPTAKIWVFHVNTIAPHPVPGPNYPDNHPGGSGYAGAYAWQLGQNCQIFAPPSPNQRITVDLDTAASPDPGAPATATGAPAAAVAAPAPGPRRNRAASGPA